MRTTGVPWVAMAALLIAAGPGLVRASIADNEVSLPNGGMESALPPINVDKLVDSILRAVRASIQASGRDAVPLPDFLEDVRYMAGAIHCRVKATNGTLRSLASITRTGDANIGVKGGEIVLTAQLGLQTMEVNYVYNASLLHMEFDGDMVANVSSNSVTLMATLKLSGWWNCQLQLKSLKISELGDIEVTLTGLTPFDGLSSAIATKIAGNMHSTIQAAAEEALRVELEKILDDVPCHTSS